MSLAIRKAMGYVCAAVVMTALAPMMTEAQATAGGATATVSTGQTATTPTASANTTRLHGTVVDPDGELIPGAKVTLTPVKGAAATQAVSGSDGTYSMTVPAGVYTLVVSMPGFSTYSALNLKVQAVAAQTLDVKMQVGMQETVVNVDADAISLSVDADSNGSAQIISGKDLEALSDDPDELQSELQALAGPSAGPNGGQIYVDGFTGGQLPPKSSIREIRINQNPFSAQYDKLGYGRVEVFTKPGTDKLHGSLQVNGNPSQFNSGSPLVGPGVYQPPYHTIFGFGNLTGPISKIASYSLGGFYRDIEDDSFTNAPIVGLTTTSTTPCAPGQAGCVPAQAQISTHTPQTRFEVTPRVDLALGSKNVLTTRFEYGHNSATAQGIGGNALPSTQYNSKSQNFELQMSDTQTLSSKLINETRFAYEQSRSSNTALSFAPTLSVGGSFTTGGSSGGNSSTHTEHYEVQNYTSIALKHNFIRFGGRFRADSEALNSQSNTNGSFFYTSLANYQAGTPSQFTQTVLNVPTTRLTLADLGLYLEDDWKVRPNLSVSYGLRYETQNHLNDHHDFAPRLSVSYGVGNGKSAPKTVLRGGFGMFYDRFALGNALVLQKQNGINTTVYTVSNPNSIAGCGPANETACRAGASQAAQTVYSAADSLRTPYIVQFAAGADQQITKYGTLTVNYLHSQGVHQLATQNIGYNFANPAATKALYQYFSEGVFQQNQLVLNGRLQAGRKISLFGYYQFGHVNGDSSGAGSFITTPGNIAADYGRTGFDVRQRLFLGGSISLPKYIQFSPFLIGQSGNPYNVTSGVDTNGDTQYNDRPLLVSSALANGTTIKTIAGCGTFAPIGSSGTAGASVAPINACTGPALFTFNFRLTKTFGFGGMKNADANAQAQQGGPGGGGPPPGGGGGGGRGGGGGGGGMGMRGGGGGSGSSTGKKYNLALGVNVQNLFNNQDLASPNSVLTSGNFGTSTQLTGGPYTSNSALRRLQLQASFNF